MERSNMHIEHGDLTPEQVHDIATIAGSSYRRTRAARHNELQDTFGDYEIIHHDKNHTLIKDNTNNHYYVSISGTNINRKEKGLRETISDLGTDYILATMGMDYVKYGSRYKAAEKFAKNVIDTHGKENVSLTGHSLGASIAREIGIQHDVASYSFNPGSSPISTFHQARDSTLDKDLRDRLKKNRTFIVSDKSGADLLSFSDLMNPYLTTHLYGIKRHANGKVHRAVKGSVLSHHHVNNFRIIK
jgi:hypothetical protein